MYCFKVSVQSCLFPNLLVLIYADLAFQYNHTYSPSCSNSYMYWFRISVSHVSNSSWFIYVLVQDITVVMPISHCLWSIHVLGQVFTVKLPSLPFTLIISVSIYYSIIIVAIYPFTLTIVILVYSFSSFVTFQWFTDSYQWSWYHHCHGHVSFMSIYINIGIFIQLCCDFAMGLHYFKSLLIHDFITDMAIYTFILLHINISSVHALIAIFYWVISMLMISPVSWPYNDSHLSISISVYSSSYIVTLQWFTLIHISANSRFHHCHGHISIPVDLY